MHAEFLVRLALKTPFRGGNNFKPLWFNVMRPDVRGGQLADIPEGVGTSVLCQRGAGMLGHHGRRIAVRAIRYRLIPAVALLFAAVSIANAETGPCKPDKFGGLTCGEGAGAARVIKGTTSPSKRLAFAWRAPGHPVTEIPDGNPIESLLIRLSDGAVLSQTEGNYWNNGTSRVNRYEQSAAWSPNNHFVIETMTFRWSTEQFHLYAIGPNDKPAVLDLKAIVEPAVRKHLGQLVGNKDDYSFAILDNNDGEPPRLRIDNGGLIKTLVHMQIPKEDNEFTFDVTFRAAETNGNLGAREVSIRRSSIKP